MPPTCTLVLKDVSMTDGRTADIAIHEGRVIHAGAARTADRTIDCGGFMVLPAAVDMHVHMRGGSQAGKEDWGTGSRSALAGGVTVVVDQPNTIPPIIDPDMLRARVLDAKTHSLCSFAINSGVTPSTPIRAMWSCGAMAFGETFFAPSSYGEAITRAELETALREIHACGAMATIHAEEISPGEDPDLPAHDRLRSGAGELRAVSAVSKANTAACQIHFCHMSTAASLAAAAAVGSTEVTPHHLFLTYEKFKAGDAFGKVNPPLRSEREQKALFAAWDLIDVIGSDHAPHTPAEKAGDFSRAPSGIPGVETMVPLLLAAVLEKKISLASVIAKTAQKPAELLGITPAGFVPGSRADFAIYPKVAVPVEPGRLHSRCGFSPFEGMPAVFPAIVILNGDVVYEHDEFFPGNPQWFAGKGYYPPG